MHATPATAAHPLAAPPIVLPPARRPRGARPSAQEELEGHAGDRSFVMSFARGMSVIQAFVNVSRPMSIAEISYRIDIPRAAVRRLLHTLSELGYVKAAGLRYTLTPKTLELGNAFTSSNDVAIGMQPIVNRLADQLRTFCAVSVPEGDHTMLMCLAGTAGHGGPHRTSSGVGSKAPLYASASGLLFLSSYTDAQLDAYFDRVAMLPITFRTQTMPEHVRVSVQQVRQQGHAVCDRTFADNLRSIAVPVRNGQGAMVAAMLAVIRADRLGEADPLPALDMAAQAAGQRWR